RRLIESQKLQVSRLIRISYGPIELGRGIKSGTAREATPAELLALLDAVGMSGADVGLEPAPRGGRAAAPTVRGAKGKPARRSYRNDDDAGSREDSGARAQRSSRRSRDARPTDRRAADTRPSTRTGDGRPSPAARGRSAMKSKPKHPPRKRR
ncbi:MAG TPA: hypothetical protein VFM56_15130, partial [Solimonas sp.]|nr:hypothetical protein [Solimonas sp.]